MQLNAYHHNHNGVLGELHFLTKKEKKNESEIKTKKKKIKYTQTCFSTFIVCHIITVHTKTEIVQMGEIFQKYQANSI